MDTWLLQIPPLIESISYYNMNMKLSYRKQIARKLRTQYIERASIVTP